MSKTANAVTEEQRYWNEEGGQRWVEHIDRIEPMLERFSVHLTAAIDAHAGERILDIGCGGGPTSATYAHLVGADGYVLGADISESSHSPGSTTSTPWPLRSFTASDSWA